jgi:hypothetical protein
MDIPPGAAWGPLGNSGYRYFDFSGAADGAQRVLLKSSTSNKAKALVKSRGLNLPDPIDTTALALPVKVQFVNHQTGKCFQSTFTTFRRSTTAQFKAKSP